MTASETAAEIARLEGILAAVESGTHATRLKMGEREIEHQKVDVVALRRRIAELKAGLVGAPRRTPARRVYF